MPINERFTNVPGFGLGVQVRPITGISSIVISGLHLTNANMNSERHFVLLLIIDGEEFQVEGKFVDETFNNRTLRGALKQRRPTAALLQQRD